VEVQRHLKAFRRGIQIIELRGIGQLVPGTPVQHRTGEAELGDCALQLGCGGLGRRCGDGGEGLEPVGPPGDDLGQCVVGLTGHAHCVFGREVLHARRGQGQDCDIDALVIHIGQALLPEVSQPPREGLVAESELRYLRHTRLGPRIEQRRQNNVLLECHDLDLVWHFAPLHGRSIPLEP
jgi:hypothetical protein